MSEAFVLASLLLLPRPPLFHTYLTADDDELSPFPNPPFAEEPTDSTDVLRRRRARTSVPRARRLRRCTSQWLLLPRPRRRPAPRACAFARCGADHLPAPCLKPASYLAPGDAAAAR